MIDSDFVDHPDLTANSKRIVRYIDAVNNKIKDMPLPVLCWHDTGTGP